VKKKTKNQAKPKKRIRRSIIKFFRNIKTDFKNITWPKPKELFKSWALVLVISGISGCLVFGFDMLGTLISKLLFF
jgi:preprotein translocase subunit SecE